MTLLDSKQMILYTWDDPLGVRKLLWKPFKGLDKPIEAQVDEVGSQEKAVFVKFYLYLSSTITRI